MRRCSGCGGQVESSFRFCPWCAAPQRRKLTEFFPAHPEIEGDRGGRSACRATSPRMRCVTFVSASGAAACVPGAFEAAVSLDESEAERLTRFLALDAESERAYGEDTQPSIRG